MRKMNYRVNNDNIIISYQYVPFNENNPYILVSEDEVIHIGYDQVINNQLIKDYVRYNKDMAYKAHLQDIRNEIYTLKEYLSNTDYMAIKHMDGALSTQEYSETKQKRQEARDRINELEKLLEQ